ncbi:MAG: sulfatase [Phycisphaerae bacterium]
MNIVFINSDTFRRDHLGLYGNRWISTPNLDRFAAESAVFDRAYAGSFPTVPNRLDVLTGTYVFPYFNWAPLPADAACFPRVLNAAGYVTMMICDTPHILQHGYNFQRDFTAFEWIRGQENDRLRTHPRDVKYPCDPRKIRDAFTSAVKGRHDTPTLVQHLRNTADRKTEADCFAARTMQAACDWLEHNHRDGKFFLYVDTFDPHEPWDPPRHYVQMYDPGYEGEEVTYPRYDFCDYMTRRELKHVRALYAGECSMVDRWVGRLLARIDDLGLRDRTLVIFTTDHGFLHGEHGIMGKSIIREEGMARVPLYEEIARIPLIVRHPKMRGGRRFDALVQPPDIAPTILDYAGVDVPEAMHGRSILPLMAGRSRAIRDIAVSSASIFAGKRTYQPSTITAGRWSMFYSNPIESPEQRETTRAVDSIGRKELDGLFDRLALFDLMADPGQRRNIARKRPDVVKMLHAKYLKFLAQIGTKPEIIEARREL